MWRYNHNTGIIRGVVTISEIIIRGTIKIRTLGVVVIVVMLVVVGVFGVITE